MKSLFSCLVLASLVGCNSNCATQATNKTPVARKGPAPAPEPSEAGKAFRLADEPNGGLNVLKARENAKDGEAVVIVGRIGGSRKPFTGRAAFTIVDPSVQHCGENGDDHCPTPWDYCCGIGKEDLAKATALVKLVGDDGQTRTDDARTLLGLTELQTVVVRGKAKRDDAGNMTVLLDGIYVRDGEGHAMSHGVDLRQLAVRREPTLPTGRRRHLLTRFVLPFAILAGFLALGAYALRDRLSPPRPVTVVPVFVEHGLVQPAGTPLFQAAGWIEPRPTPIIVTALTEGVIEKLLVVEGQAVKAGEPIAHLIDADAKIALQFAEAELQHHEADMLQANIAIKAAKSRLEHPVHLEAALAEAAANLAKLETERSNLPFQVRAAEARQVLARVDWETKSSAGPGAVPARTLAQAQAELAIAIASVEELQQRRTSLDREIAALTARRDAIRKQLELKTDEIRQFDEAKTSLAVAHSRVAEALAKREVVRLRIERLTIKAPQAGRVLNLVGRPGKRVMGLDPTSMFDSSTIAVLYDPHKLQVRADVPLEQVGKVVPGHPVRIETEALPGKALDGVVLQPTGQADVQKNTLQVKVAITDPPPVIKPDMLSRVTFLAAAPPADAPKTESTRLFVPRSLIESGPQGARVWIADANGIARAKTIKQGTALHDDLIEIVEGIGPADKLIASGRDGLQDGDRIAVTGEDVHLGVHTTTPGGGTKMDRREPRTK